MGGGVSFIDGHIDEPRRCENCAYYDNDRADMPCASCVEFENWERYKEND